MNALTNNLNLEDGLKTVRASSPLIHAITNYVTINDCANITLGAGASPAMCESRDEVKDFVPLVQALYINIGTLNREQRDAIYLAVEKASDLNVPVILDPVGAVGLESRQRLIKDLLAKYRVSCLKGNIAEIKSLTGRDAQAKGVDSLDTGEEIDEANKELSNSYDTIVVATGKTDYITYGEQTYCVENGIPLLGKITGSGCMLGMLISSFIGCMDNKLLAALTATTTMGVVGELAAADLEKETDVGSFHVKLFDYMAGLTEKQLVEMGRYYEVQ